MTFETWPTVLSTQILQSLGIITACMPSLKPFQESPESGMLRSAPARHRLSVPLRLLQSHPSSTSRSNGKKAKANLASNPSTGKHHKLPGNISIVVLVNRNEDPERDSDSQKSSARIIKCDWDKHVRVMAQVSLICQSEPKKASDPKEAFPESLKLHG
ncbi:MAG: hypothetical protein Q9223_007489 [Gallowayella weberi]